MCEFSRQLPGPAAQVIQRVRQPIEAHGGSLVGNEQGGTIRVVTPVGEVGGDYTISGTAVAFRITQKPFFVPCGIIEATVDRYLFG
jgi:hypothetical protein